MARTPAVTREAVPEAQRETFDAIVAERGGVPSGGPGSVMLNAPEVAQRAGRIRAISRDHPSLRQHHEGGQFVAFHHFHRGSQQAAPQRQRASRCRGWLFT